MSEGSPENPNTGNHHNSITPHVPGLVCVKFLPRVKRCSHLKPKDLASNKSQHAVIERWLRVLLSSRLKPQKMIAEFSGSRNFTSKRNHNLDTSLLYLLSIHLLIAPVLVCASVNDATSIHLKMNINNLPSKRMVVSTSSAFIQGMWNSILIIFLRFDLVTNRIYQARVLSS